MSSILVTLQRSIEALADVDTDLDVSRYVVDGAQRECLPGGKDGLPEQLFVLQAGADLELALYVDPQVVDRLECDDPLRRLHAGNLESYCIALEGVSHFVFVAYRARLGRPVSALELEIQAEVDKFVAAWILMTAQGQDREATAARLVRDLFVRYALRDDVEAQEVDRYHTASRAAARSGRALAERYGADHDTTRLTREVRRYYRQGLAEKMRAA